jgi:hypothetical protein
MKTLLKVLITIILVISVLLGLLFSYTNSENVAEVEANEATFGALSTLANMVGQGDTVGDIPTAADYQRAVYVDVIFFLACIVGIVFTFLRKKTAGLIVAGVVGLMAILMYVLQPSLNGEAFQDSNSDKQFALGICLATLFAVGLLVLLKLKFSHVAASQPQAASSSADQPVA